MAHKSQGSLDTNVILRLLLDDVPVHTKIVDKLLTNTAVYEIADMALVEVIFVLEKIYTMPRALITENILGIIRNTQFNCNRKLFERVLPNYAANTNVSIADCLLVEYARLQKALPLHTFDVALTKSYPADTVLLT